MRLRNCPKCYGGGRRGHAGPCDYCHGKKKVNSEFVKWKTAHAVYEHKVTDRAKKKFYDLLWKQVGEKMSAWEKQHSRPKKFP